MVFSVAKTADMGRAFARWRAGRAPRPQQWGRCPGFAGTRVWRTYPEARAAADAAGPGFGVYGLPIPWDVPYTAAADDGPWHVSLINAEACELEGADAYDLIGRYEFRIGWYPYPVAAAPSPA